MAKAELTLAELGTIRGALPAGAALNLVNAKIIALTRTDAMEQRVWNTYAAHFGLPADGIGKTFIIKGRRYEILGLNPGAPSFPIEAVRLPDRKPFRCRAADAARAA